jgi:hypothetical protein
LLTGGAAFAQEQTVPPEQGPKPLPSRDALGRLFRQVEISFLNGDAARIGELLSPTVSAHDKETLLKQLKREFSATKYNEFELDDAQTTVLDGPMERNGYERYQVLVPCKYIYVSRNPGIGSMAGTNEYAYNFSVEIKGGQWWIVNSTLFATSGMSNSALQLGKLVFVGFIGALITAFWMWMSYHRLRKTRSVWKGFVLFLTTPLGAVVYFFRNYLQEPPEEETK